MPLTKSDSPNLLLSGIKALFYDTLTKISAGSEAERIAMLVESGKDQEKYAWLGSVPKMREFVGERQINAMIESSYTIVNKTWESTLGVDRTALEDDLYGQIRIRVQSLAMEAKRHVEELVFTLLASGFSSTCFDGQYFFDTDHVTPGAEYQTSQSNKGTTALSASSLQTAITAMAKFKDDRGRPMGISADTLVVPPDLEWTAREILSSVYWPDSTGTSAYQKLPNNVMKDRLELVVSPYLSDTSDWFVLCSNGIIKPLILQRRTPVEFESLEGASESGFLRDQYLYGVRSRYNAGFGMWQFAYGSQVS